MPPSPWPAPADLIRIAPEIVLTLAGVWLMILDPLLGRRRNRIFGHLTILACVGAIGGAAWAHSVPGPAFSQLLRVDGFATFFRVLVL